MVIKQSFKRKNSRGFALVILAVILSVAGVLLLTLMQTESEKLSGQIKSNTNQLTNITKALYEFYERNGYFPCPASLTTPMSASTYGVASDPSVCNITCPTTSPTGGIICSTVSGATTVRVGAVPVRTLGLSDNDALDQWNNRFTYVVDTDKWKSFTLSDLASNATSIGAIVLSHGKDGRGSYLKNGGANPQTCTLAGASATLSELENCDALTASTADRLFYKSSWNTSAANYFDDLVSVLYKCPGDVGNCSLWYDANDSTAVTLNSTNISVWKDKSGQGHNAVQATAGNQPAYYATGYTRPYTGESMGIATFDGFDDYMSLPSAITDIANWTSFAVVNRLDESTNMLTLANDSFLNPSTLHIDNFGLVNSSSVSNGTNYQTSITDYPHSTYIWSTTASGTGTSIWKNGELRSSPGGVSMYPAGETFNLLGHNFYNDIWMGTFDNYANGNMHEVILYPSALTDAERKRVQCYLSAKWGLYVPGCCPANTNGCSLWLDAADVNNTGISPANNEAISIWKDKSGYGYDAIQGTTTKQPLFKTNILNNATKPVIWFDGTDDWLAVADAIGSRTGATVFIAFRMNTANALIGWFEDRHIFLSSTGVQWRGSNMVGFNVGGSSPAANSTNVHTYRFLGGGISQNWRNGVSLASTSGSPASLASSIGGAIGGYNSSPGTAPATFSNNDIAEVVVYPMYLNDTDRSKIECYLGDKWGMIVQGCCPANIPGCGAWYDASARHTIFGDPGGTTMGGSPVSTWKDKSWSATNRDVTAATTARPAYSATGYSATMGAVTWDGTTDKMTLTNNLGTPTTWTVFAVVSRAVGARMITFGASSNTNATTSPTLFRIGTDNLVYLRDSARSRNRTAQDITTAATIWTSQDSGSLLSLRKNGEPITALTSQTTGTSAAFNLLGGRGASGEFSNGKMMEVVYYPSPALSPTQIKTIECYLADKWGLCGSLYGGGAAFCSNLGLGINYCGGTNMETSCPGCF